MGVGQRAGMESGAGKCLIAPYWAASLSLAGKPSRDSRRLLTNEAARLALTDCVNYRRLPGGFSVIWT